MSPPIKFTKYLSKNCYLSLLYVTNDMMHTLKSALKNFINLKNLLYSGYAKKMTIFFGNDLHVRVTFLILIINIQLNILNVFLMAISICTRVFEHGSHDLTSIKIMSAEIRILKK